MEAQKLLIGLASHAAGYKRTSKEARSRREAEISDVNREALQEYAQTEDAAAAVAAAATAATQQQMQMQLDQLLCLVMQLALNKDV